MDMSLAERLAKSERPDKMLEARSRIQTRLVEVLGPKLYDSTVSEKEMQDLVFQRLQELLAEEESPLSVQERALFLHACVRGRLNVMVSGGTGAGKTTTLNALSSFIPEDERIITIEDSAELRLQQPHVVRLEYRPPNIESKGEVTIRDLVKNALRMRPDRIVVGEVRGAEAIDMLQAMNTGHDGSISTIHANSPRDSLSRLETMALMAGMDLTVRALREQIASAVDLIVHQARLKDGTRRLTHITELVGMEGDVITLQDLFLFDFKAGVDDHGKFLGQLQATGLRPHFLEKLRDRGISVPARLFAPPGGMSRW